MIGYLGRTWFSFIAFLKSPNEDNEMNAPIGFKIKTLLSFFTFSLILSLIFGAVYQLLKLLNLLDPGPNVVEDLLYDFTFVQLVLIAAVFVPVLEELIFRLPLRYNYNYLFQFIVFLVSMTRLLPKEKLNEVVKLYWKRIFKYFFYSLSILFGLVHMTNFEGYKDMLAWMPFLTINQIFAGLSLGYIRIKFGLLWSILHHSFFNFVFFGYAFLSLSTISDYEYKNDLYAVSIKRASKPANAAQSYFRITPQNIEFNQCKLSDVFKVLEEKPDKYIKISEFKGMYINLEYQAESNKLLPASGKKIVLDDLQKALSIQIKSYFERKEALELCVLDSIKGREANTSNPNIPKKNSLKQIGHALDYTYSNYFILGNDTNRIYPVEINRKLSFQEMEEYLLKYHGLGFKRVTRELEFIKVNRQTFGH